MYRVGDEYKLNIYKYGCLPGTRFVLKKVTILGCELSTQNPSIHPKCVKVNFHDMRMQFTRISR